MLASYNRMLPCINTCVFFKRLPCLFRGPNTWFIFYFDSPLKPRVTLHPLSGPPLNHLETEKFDTPIITCMAHADNSRHILWFPILASPAGFRGIPLMQVLG